MNGNGAALRLPAPGRARWQPLRAGLVDLFYYDREEFWFRDGRLLLRGNNGTGKSKVLALMLPFLLDGDLTPQRVEPDGDPRKRMEWNLLLGGAKGDRLGYTWVEFGRRDAGQARYLTVGCGLRATSGRPGVDRWFFTTDQRVGADLHLVSPSGVARNRARLAEAIGDRGRVHETATAYRRDLDERLFGLGEERYAALVDLLIQLRQPQLSKRPSEAALNAALTQALPPLDGAVLADVAAAFRSLETEREELAGLKDARAAADRFLGHYGRYAGIASRRKAEATRKAQSRYEQTGRRLADARRLLAEAAAAETALVARLEGLNVELEAANAAERTLRDSPTMRDARELERATTDAARAAEALRRAETDVAEAEEALAAAAGEVERTGQAEAASREALVTAQAEAGQAATRAGLPTVDPATDPEQVAQAEAAARQAAERRERAVSHVRGLAQAVLRAEEALARERRRRDDLATERDAAAERLTAAEQEARSQGQALVAAFAAYLTGTRELRLPDPDGVLAALDDWAGTLQGPNPASVAVAAAARATASALATVGEHIAAGIRGLDAEAWVLEDERSRLEAGEDTAPPVPHTRPPGIRERRPGAPLWRLVDFADGVGEAERAGLEAALEASGLLDAWVTPDGSLLDPGTLDVVVTAVEPAERHVGLALRPAVDRDDPAAAAVADETVQRVLAGIGLGPATADSWVDADGRWRLGVAEGAWAKPVAEFVGHGAREAARRRSLAELAGALVALAARRAEQAQELQRLAARERTLEEEVAGAPSDTPLREAAVRAEALLAERVRLDQRLSTQESAVQAAGAEVARTAGERDEAAADLRVPPDLDGLDDLASALIAYRGAVAALWPAVRGHAAALAAGAHARGRAEAAGSAAARRQEHAREARREAGGAEARRATLAATVGVAVAELQERLDGTGRLLRRLAAELKRLGDQRLTLHGRVGEAGGRAKELDRQLAEAAEQRAEATAGFQRFAATGLLSTALPDLELPALDAPWAPDPTVRLTRRVEAGLADIEMDEVAWERNQRGIANHLSDLTDVLSRYGHTAAGEHTDDGVVVTVVFQGVRCPPRLLAGRLAEEVGERERILAAREREVIENHLVNEVASHLRDLLAEADDQVRAMNAELEERPTSTGMRLRFVWEPSPEAPAGLSEARRRLLRQTVDAWSAEDRRAVESFLHAQIQAVRAADEGGTWNEHLTRALDYRSWHRFTVQRWQDGTWRPAVGPASGGERALTVTVPLFAAASAHYRSATNPHAPRLVLLDEAFAGVDDDSRAKCMGLLTTFDLDFVMTSEREWGCYAELPGLAIAQIARLPGIDAVHVTCWEWDGRTRSRADVDLPPLTEPVEVPAGGEDVLW